MKLILKQWGATLRSIGFRVLSNGSALLGISRLFLAFSDKWRITPGTSTAPKQRIPRIGRRAFRSYQILVYHHVNDRADPFFGGMPIAVFRKQMETLSSYFNVLPLEDLLLRAKEDDLPDRAVAITIDDGYRDSYLCAFPILKDLGLPATLFLTTGGVDTVDLMWHDVVFDAFRRTQVSAVSFCNVRYPLVTLEDRKAAQVRIRRHLRKVDLPERDALIRNLTFQLAVGEPCKDFAEMISWQEAREMAQHRITIGAHTVTHPILTRISPTQAAEEIVRSKEMIQKQLNREVRLFAYPNGQRGDFNERVKQAVRAAGFGCAVTTIEGDNSKQSDAFELRRYIDVGLDPHLLPLKLGWKKLRDNSLGSLESGGPRSLSLTAC